MSEGNVVQYTDYINGIPLNGLATKFCVTNKSLDPVIVMVNFRCQPDCINRCPVVGKAFLGISVRMFSEEIGM